jgi:hypothetical protein
MIVFDRKAEQTVEGKQTPCPYIIIGGPTNMFTAWGFP